MRMKPVVGFLSTVFFLMGVHSTYAALLYMDPASTTLSMGDTTKVSVRLDTDEGECVNVVDAVISYPSSIQLVDVSRGSSIMSIWVEDPVIDTTNNTITFAGGVPNGYCGRIDGDPRLTNVVIDLLFQAPGFVIGGSEGETNQATIAFSDQTQVLLNDGRGSQAPLSFLGTVIHLTKKPGATISNEWSDIVSADKLPPEKFSITLDRSANAYSNDWFIVFNTTDKQSGIDHYEVIEESLDENSFFNWGRADAPWVTAKSPYVLKDQSLNSTIRVRAIDKAGNEYIATYVPEESQRSVSPQTKIMIAVIATSMLVFVFAGIVSFLIYRRKKNVAEIQDDTTEYEETS